MIVVDVLVIGAGVAGILSALELLQRGCSVRLLDAGVARQPASWAGGGILSPLFPWRYPDAMVPLTHNARRDYGLWRDRILAAGGPDPELLDGGMLVLEPGDDEQALVWAGSHGVRLEQVRAARHMPWLAERSALWLPEVARIRNPRLLKGLDVLRRQAGIELDRQQVVSLEPASESVQVLTSFGRIEAGRVLLTAGAWTAGLLPQSLCQRIFPVRGQMLLYRPAEPFPGSVLLSPSGYLIPRADGLLLAGSTVETGIEDSIPTEQAFAQLTVMAEQLWPVLRGVTPVAQWAGIRPGSINSLPMIGEVPDSNGRIWVNSGHFRNGLVCAPASARLVADLICGLAPGFDPAPYSVSGSSSSPP
jgi:glycine oxidase